MNKKIKITSADILRSIDKRSNQLRLHVSLLIFMGIVGAIMFLLMSACEDAVPLNVQPIQQTVPLKAVTLKTAMVLSIASGMGNTNGLRGSGVSGTRVLTTGDQLHSGDNIFTGIGLNATLVFDDGTTVHLLEKSKISLGINGDVVVEGGEVHFSRPLQIGDPFAFAVGKVSLGLVSGRAIALIETNGDISLRVSNGEVEYSHGHSLITAGQIITVSPSGEVTINKSRLAATPIDLRSIRSLAPEGMAFIAPKDLLRGIGSLTARIPRSNKISEGAMSITRHAVDVTIEDGVALTKIEESFTNNSAHTVEATYKFLLPSEASITRLALDINGRIEEGEVLEKRRAARIFKQIVDDSVRPRDPALLEWERGSSFSMKIFPIKAGETRRVFITYMEPMVSVNGHVQYVYPLGSPSGTPDVGQFSVKVHINSPMGIQNAQTPLYPSNIKLSDNRAELSFEATKYAPSVDYVVEYTRQEKTAEARVAVQTEKNGQRYAMLLVQPDVDIKPKDGGKRILAVVDTSYGLSPEIRALSTSVVVELVASMGRDDTFNVIACDSGCKSLGHRFEQPSPEALVKVHSFLTGIEPGGASDLLGALIQSFTEARKGVETTIIYIGDGIPTSGELDGGKLLSLLAKTRPPNVTVHTVGVGSNLDAAMLNRIAATLGGSAYNISAGESSSSAASKVVARLMSPGIKDVTIQWPPGIVDAYPKTIGFIPSGEEISFTGVLKGREGPGEIVLRGLGTDGIPVEKRYQVSLDSKASRPGFISRLWARDHIDHLEFEGGASQEIVDISRRMRVASRQTSWIVLENQRMYDRFKVQRTDAEIWDGTPTNSFVDAEESEDTEDSLQDLLEASSIGSSQFKSLNESAYNPNQKPGVRSPSKSKKKSPPASRLRAVEDNFGGGSGIASPSLDDKYKPRRECSNTYDYEISISGPTIWGSKANKKIADLAAQVREEPLSRKRHQRYVRLLSRLGRLSEAYAASDAWRKADPMGTGALAGFADQLARRGERLLAMRMYAALAELRPKSAKFHERLAKGFRDMGDYDAAAGHFKAAVTLKKKRQNSVIMNYLFCLAASGRLQLFKIEASNILGLQKHRSIHKNVNKLLLGVEESLLPVWPNNITKGAFTVKLHIDQPGADLDLAIIDPVGRRISGLWQRGSSSKNLVDNSIETLILNNLINGRYQILVSQTQTNDVRPVSGRIVIKVRNKRRTLPFTVSNSETIVGAVKYKRTKSTCRF